MLSGEKFQESKKKLRMALANRRAVQLLKERASRPKLYLVQTKKSAEESPTKS